MADSTQLTPNLIDAVVAAQYYARQALSSASTASTAAADAENAAEVGVTNIFYGGMSVDPATRPNGDPSQDGDMYFNTVRTVMKIRYSGVWAVLAPPLPVTQPVNANRFCAVSDTGKVLAVTTGSIADVTIILHDPVDCGDGAIMFIQKFDSGTRNVIVKDADGATVLITFSTQWQLVKYRSDGQRWRAWS
jgi:hypothetical protein